MTAIFLSGLYNYNVLYAAPKSLGNENNSSQEWSNSQTQSNVSQTDDIAPIIQPLDPDSNATEVARNTHIQFKLQDDNSLLDLETFFVKVDNEDVTGKVVNSGDLSDMTFTYNSEHEMLFNYNQTVWVHVHVADRAGNVSDVKYKFTTEREHQSPIIEFIHPKNNDSGISQTVTPEFKVTDEMSGIDLSSLVVSVNANGKEVEFDLNTPVTLSNGYELQLIPKNKFSYNDEIKIYVSIKDKSENAAEETCLFYIKRDDLQPDIRFIKPKENEREVPLNINPIIEIHDNLSGVDTSTIEFELWVNDEPDNRKIDWYPPTKITNGYKYILNPSTDFNRNDVVLLWVYAEDSAGNSITDSCQFFIERDDELPVIEFLKPTKNETEVDRHTTIEIEAFDKLSGIDSNSIKISLKVNDNEDPRELNIEKNPMPGGYQILLHPKPAFNYNDDVSVSVTVYDLAGNQNSDVCHFWVQVDTIAPLIKPISPKPDTGGVKRDHQIKIRVTDERSGVDIGSALLLVNGENKAFTHNGEMLTYEINADHLADWNGSVTIHFSVKDSAGNPNSLTYGYKIETDSQAPSITLEQPNPTVDVEFETDVEYKITDDSSGVDQNSIRLYIDGNEVNPDKSLWPNQNNYKVTYSLSGYSYTYNDTAILYIEAADNVGHKSETRSDTLYFKRDDVGPLLEPIYPRNKAPNVAPDDLIHIVALDMLSGVDASRVTMNVMVDGNPISGEVSTITRNDSAHIIFKNHDQFPLDKTVDVTCTVYDHAGNKGELTNYSFKVKDNWDQEPPIIVFVDPEKNEEEVPLNIKPIIEVTDNLSGVDTSRVQFELWVNDAPDTRRLKPEFTKLNTNGYRIILTPEYSFGYNQKVKLKVTVFDLAKPENPTEDECIFYTILDSIGPKITPITPKPDAKGVNPNHQIVIQAKDDQSGIDAASCVLIVNGKKKAFDDYPGTNLVSVISAHFANWNEVITVYFSVKDLMGNQNSLLYKYKIKTDSQPPQILLQHPDSTVNVEFNTEVKYLISDDSSGVDENSIKLHVDGVEVTPAKIPLSNKRDYAVIYPISGYTYNDSVILRIEAADISENKSVSRYDTLYFKRDDTPPIFTDLSPDSNRPDVPRNTQISFTIRDSLSGVDKNSIIVKVNGNTISFEKAGVDSAVNVSFNGNFDYSETVTVFVKAADKVGNMDSLKYHFTIDREDHTPPVVSLISPTANAKGEIELSIPRFVFNMKDDISGVDKNSIQVIITAHDAGWNFGRSELPLGIPPEPNSLDLDVTCELEDKAFSFNYNDTIQITIKAKDIAGNAMTETIGLFSIRDIDPPYITHMMPEETSEVDPSDGSNVSITLKDLISGIDKSSIKVWITVLSIGSEEPQIWNDDDELISQGKITRCWDDRQKEEKLELINSLKLDYNECVWIHLEASDKVKPNPNEMDTTVYFCTETINPDLTVEACDAAGKTFAVNDSVTVTVTIKNVNAPVTIPFYISFEADEGMDPVNVLVREQLDKDQTLPVKATLFFKSQGKYTLTITVDSKDDIYEEDESNNQYTVEVRVEGGVVVVRPNPFTPNGDGRNDNAYFYCDTFILENPYIKLFNLRGRSVRELNNYDVNEYNENEKKFIWDGRGDSGQALMPGLYLFVLRDKGENLASGGVVLAR